MHSGQESNGNDAAPGSRRWVLSAGIVLAGSLVWWLLARWIPSGSERFYLLVPPITLGLAAARRGIRWPTRRRRWILALAVGVLLAVLCVGYNLTLTARLFPVSGGYWRGLSVPEVAIALYFLLALYLLAALSRRGLRPPLVRILGCLAPVLPRGRRLARVAAVESILLVGLAPLVVGTFHVHRFKIPNPVRPAALAGRKVEDVQFTSSDGLRLRGWFVAGELASDRTLLICHGMGANRTEVLPYLAVGDGLHANVLLFDFRGHGDSDGHTLSFGHYEKLDVHAAVNYLRQCRPAQARQIIGLGISMGTAALIGAAAELKVPLDALIVDSGFAVVADMPEHLLASAPALLRQCLLAPALPLASLDAACWLPDLRPIDQIGKVRAPVLIIHARGDRLIPVEQAQKLYEGAAQNRELWITQTGDHGSAFTARAEYLQRVQRFVQAHISAPNQPTLRHGRDGKLHS